MTKRKEKIKFGRPQLYETPAKLEEGVRAYFKFCQKEKQKPGICGLAAFLGMSRVTLLRYEKKYDDPEKIDIIQRARTTIEAFNEQYLYDNKTFQGAKFIMQNNFNYDAENRITNINENVDISYEDYLKELNSDEKY